MTEKISVIDCREHRIEWSDIQAAPPAKQHLYSSLDGQGIRAVHENWEAFICRDIMGAYHVRVGSGKSHLNLVAQFTGVETLDEAKAKAEADIRKRAAAALKRRIQREAKKAMAAACLLIAGIVGTPTAEALGNYGPVAAQELRMVADTMDRRGINCSPIRGFYTMSEADVFFTDSTQMMLTCSNGRIYLLTVGPAPAHAPIFNRLK